MSDAISYLRSCPKGNDPLEFVFGDLVEDFSYDETRVLCALTYFTLPAKIEHISELAGCLEADANIALRSLVNRSLVVPSDELKTFTVVPLVADFLRKKKPELVRETGDRLVSSTYALIVENGYEKYDRFSMLEAAWPTIAAALPRFLAGPNDWLQTACNALMAFLEFTGRWDEWLALSSDAETRALKVSDFGHAGWLAYHAGWVHYLRGQSAEVLTCADRAQAHWREAQAGAREQASAIGLRGIGLELAKDYPAAITAYREAIALDLTVAHESRDIATDLSYLAGVERLSGDLDAAERDYREALRIAKAVNHHSGVASSTGNLALLALTREDWLGAEAIARQALALSEKLGRQQLIASHCRHLAKSLVRQGKNTEALPYAQRAVALYGKLGMPEMADAQAVLAECQS